MRVFARVSAVGLLSFAAFSQVDTAPSAFEIASGDDAGPDQDRLRLYADNGFGGPAWLDRDRFDVVAKAPPATPPEAGTLMFQRLLANRFKLVVRKDTRTVPGFVLTAGKSKPKWKEAEDSGNAGCQEPPQPRPDPKGDTASDPAGGVSLFGAAEKQLGLKLQAHKRPIRVLVNDHIEQKPTDN